MFQNQNETAAPDGASNHSAKNKKLSKKLLNNFSIM